ncbi:tetraspanin-3-like [Actinia tenebrosa]|uniref:Tetraspanin n=1 Tax=Actinia tenebrosa TaxID=6105 RepID=A0A6P8I965_ACTTE|nr:tetraspanin-3-like [Actinia tenebrosa]
MGNAKAFLYLFNFIYLGISGLLIYVAVWLIKSYRHFYDITSNTYTVVPAGIIIGVGCLVLLTAVIGCCGTCYENKCCLSFFFFLLLLAFSLEISAGVLGALYKNEAKEDVHKGLDAAIEHYNNTNTGTDKVIDYVQHKLKCCGDNTYQDWLKSDYYKKYRELPHSCCPNEGSACRTLNVLNKPYTDGCYEQLRNKFDHYLTYIIGIGIGFAILQLFGMIASCFVMCKSGDISYAPLHGGTFV